jgi:hypothetical protein
MKRFGTVLFVMLLATAWCYGQNAEPTGHGSFPAKVTKTLDSSKLKEGDTVDLETGGSFKLPDGTLVPKGSKIVGHVVAAKARSKGDSDSQLTLAFDKVEIVNGKQLPIKGTVQAVFPPVEEPTPQMAGKASGAAGGGYAPGSTGGGYAAGTMGTVTDPKTGSNMEVGNAQPVASPGATGVQGIHDLDLEDGVLRSKGKQVKLGGGVRMIVRADILG